MRQFGRLPLLSHRALERAAVWLSVICGVGLLARLSPTLEGPAAFVALLAFGLAYLAADAVSGLVHWGFDRLVDEDTPYLGPHFVRPFREHHTDPLAITRHDFVELNGNTCIAAAPVLAATGIAFDPASAGVTEVAAAAFIASLAFWTIATNVFHRWAHEPAPPQLARRLQRWRVVLAPGHHARHHREPFDVCFCITSGWLNPLLDRFGVFGRLEVWAGRAAGTPSTRWAK